VFPCFDGGPSCGHDHLALRPGSTIPKYGGEDYSLGRQGALQVRSLSALHRLRPDALRGPSHSLRPAARARPQGQRRVHHSGLETSSPRAAQLRRRGLMVGWRQYRSPPDRARTLAAVQVLGINAKLAAKFRRNPRRRENTQELAAINRRGQPRHGSWFVGGGRALAQPLGCCNLFAESFQARRSKSRDEFAHQCSCDRPLHWGLLEFVDSWLSASEPLSQSRLTSV
jgi:hypothetical protein